MGGESKMSEKENSVYKTDGGASMLLDPADPKYRKLPKKVVDIKVNDSKKVKEENKLWRKLRPVVGLVSSPYLLIRPIVRKLSELGNSQFDKVFHPEKNEQRHSKTGKAKEAGTVRD